MIRTAVLHKPYVQQKREEPPRWSALTKYSEVMVAALAFGAQPRSALAAVAPYPAYVLSLTGQLVAKLLAVHPTRPFLAELIVGDPPFARVRRTIASREARRDGSDRALHPPIGGITDGEFET